MKFLIFLEEHLPREDIPTKQLKNSVLNISRESYFMGLQVQEKPLLHDNLQRLWM